MTQQYKTGVWYAHNGEPQPVHDKTVVEVMSEDYSADAVIAAYVDWEDLHGAFKIIETYIEPREFIVTIAENGDLSVHRCDNPPPVQHAGCEYLTVREVV